MNKTETSRWLYYYVDQDNNYPGFDRDGSVGSLPSQPEAIV